jgi:nitroreductase
MEKGLKEILAIPEPVTVVAITPLGYPAKFPPPQPRRPLESVLHRDTWGTSYVRGAAPSKGGGVG